MVEKRRKLPKKVRMSKSKMALLSRFLDINGVVHHEYVPPGRTVNAKFDIQVLERLELLYTA